MLQSSLPAVYTVPGQGPASFRTNLNHEDLFPEVLITLWLEGQASVSSQIPTAGKAGSEVTWGIWPDLLTLRWAPCYLRFDNN